MADERGPPGGGDGPRGPPDISGMCSLKARRQCGVAAALRLQNLGPAPADAAASARPQVDNLGYHATQDDVKDTVRVACARPRGVRIGLQP
jgi:hypothetical protein